MNRLASMVSRGERFSAGVDHDWMETLALPSNRMNPLHSLMFRVNSHVLTEALAIPSERELLQVTATMASGSGSCSHAVRRAGRRPANLLSANARPAEHRRSGCNPDSASAESCIAAELSEIRVWPMIDAALALRLRYDGQEEEQPVPQSIQISRPKISRPKISGAR